jgi:hypothetical protein
VTADVERFGPFSYRIEGELPEIGRARQGFFLTHEWAAPLVYVSEHDRWPDLWPLAGTSMLVLTADAATALMPFAAMAGELLPLRTETDTDDLLALNIVNVVDVLDRAAYEKRGAAEPAFIAHRLDEPTLFRVPQITGGLFCLERDDADDSFMRRIAARGLAGLVFEEVWQGDTDTS